MRHTLRLLTVAVGLVALAALSPWSVTTAAAQDPNLFRPSTAETCAQWSGTLAGGGAPAREVLQYGRLASCPNAGPSALAGAVARAGSERDTAYLTALMGGAGPVTHPAVFAAALQLVGDRSATVESRAAGLLMLAGQSGSGMGVNNRYGGALLTEALPAAGVCLTTVRGTGGAAPASAPLPSDAPRQAAVVLDRLRTDPSEPSLLRTLARCVRHAVADGVPPQVDVSGVRLAYDCGDWFRIHNPTSEPLMFAFAAEKTGERHNILVPPGGERRFGIAGPSTVRLYYDGRLIQTQTYGNTKCPAK